MDKLIGALQDAMAQVTKEDEKEKFRKGLEIIKKIRNQEEQEENEITDEELDKLLDTV